MSQSSNTPYDALEVGQTASYSKTVEERDIQLFAAVSGDRNPVHLDAEYAATTMFKQRIAHGMFSGALISAAVACETPRTGHIYMGPPPTCTTTDARNLGSFSGFSRRTVGVSPSFTGAVKRICWPR